MYRTTKTSLEATVTPMSERLRVIVIDRRVPAAGSWVFRHARRSLRLEMISKINGLGDGQHPKVNAGISASHVNNRC
jgi:hypothetical protein